jgi:hypothetical protein
MPCRTDLPDPLPALALCHWVEDCQRRPAERVGGKTVL